MKRVSLTLAALVFKLFQNIHQPKRCYPQAEEKGLVLSPVENFQAIEEKVQGQIDQQRQTWGNENFMTDKGCDPELEKRMVELQEQAKTDQFGCGCERLA